MIAERVIDNAQTADVAPVRHGQWTEKGYCSRCGCDIPVIACGVIPLPLGMGSVKGKGQRFFVNRILRHKEVSYGAR